MEKTGKIEKLRSLIEYFEKDRFSLLTIFWLVVAIGIIRAYLEGMCVTGEIGLWVLNRNDIMTSLAAFFIGTLMAAYFAKVRIRKMWNVAILFWFIFFLPPVIDYVFSGGCAQFNYDFAYLDKLDWRILFPPVYLTQSNFSPGVVFQYISAVMSAIYVYVKTGSIKRTVMFYVTLVVPGYMVLTHPRHLLTQFWIVWQTKAIPLAYEWYYLLFSIGALLILIRDRKKVKIPRRFLLFSAALMIFYMLGFYLSPYQSLKPFTQVLKYSPPLLALLAFFMLQKPSKTQKELAYICLSFAPFVGLFVDNFYIKALGFLPSLIVLLWYRFKRFPRLFLTAILTSSYIFGYLHYNQLFFMDQNFSVVLGVAIVSYLIARLFWKQGHDSRVYHWVKKLRVNQFFQFFGPVPLPFPCEPFSTSSKPIILL